MRYITISVLGFLLTCLCSLSSFAQSKEVQHSLSGNSGRNTESESSESDNKYGARPISSDKSPQIIVGTTSKSDFSAPPNTKAEKSPRIVTGTTSQSDFSAPSNRAVIDKRRADFKVASPQD